jgi:TolA-binding protein
LRDDRARGSHARGSPANTTQFSEDVVMSRAGYRALGFAALLVLCAAMPAAAQFNEPTHMEIRGQVRYNNGAPAFDVIVRLERQSGGFEGEVRTDRLGKFQFRDLMPIQYRVKIHHPGFLEIDREVNLVIQSSDYVQLLLAPDANAPREATANGGALVRNANVPPAAQKEYDAGRALVLDEKKQNLDEGIRHLEKAMMLYPEFLEAQLLLSTSYMDMKQWEKAEAGLRNALKINPKAATAHFALGEVFRRQKKYKEAEQELLAGLKLDDKSVQGHFTLGRVYFEQNDLPKAGPHVGTALQLDPRLAEGHLLAGNILLKARQPENALAEFQAYLVLAPNGEFAPQARSLVEKIKQAMPPKKN